MSEQGFVGFFDILGYQAIIDSNEISSVSKLISDVILQLPLRTKDLLVSFFDKADEQTKEDVKKDFSTINTKVISDSILISMPVQGDDLPAEVGLKGLMFLSYSSQLMRQSFDKGLPLRGAIDYGEFYLTENCFAGKPIINCYRLGSELDAAACVITKSCSEKIGDLISIRTLHFDCTIVNKDGSNNPCQVLNWYNPFADWGAEPQNLRSYVIDAFQANGKNISSDVISKVNNTEIMLHQAAKRNL